LTAKIVIASTLKPVWDPRAYEKFAKSLLKEDSYAVSIIGSQPNFKTDEKNITTYAHAVHGKGLLNRITLPFSIFRKLIKLKPSLVIFTTHELLLITVLFKLLYKKKIIYDIQENYNYNLRYQDNYPTVIKLILATYIRFKERFFSQWIDHFFLAEKCYLDEILFLKNKARKITILENKYQPIEGLIKQPKGSKIELLLSGTIAPEYGVFEAIHFFEKLPREKYSLKIIGHCPNKQNQKKIEEMCSSLENCKLMLDNSPIPHRKIAEQISDNTIGLLPYRGNKSTENKVPTKLFEYLAMNTPILISVNPTWSSLVDQYQGGASINFNNPPHLSDLSICVNLINNNHISHYKELMWLSEENKFIDSVSAVLKK